MRKNEGAVAGELPLQEPLTTLGSLAAPLHLPVDTCKTYLYFWHIPLLEYRHPTHHLSGRIAFFHTILLRYSFGSSLFLSMRHF